MPNNIDHIEVLSGRLAIRGSEVAFLKRAHRRELPEDNLLDGITSVDCNLLDQDGWSALGHAFRWMSRRRKWPHRRERYATRGSHNPVPTRAVPAQFRWAWYRRPLCGGDDTVSGVWPVAKRETHGLPALLLHGEQKVCATHQEAVMFLAGQLSIVGETYTVEPSRPKGLLLTEVIDTGGIRTPPVFAKDDAEVA